MTSLVRRVKLRYEAAMKVCDKTAWDGYIRAELEAIKELPTFGLIFNMYDFYIHFKFVDFCANLYSNCVEFKNKYACIYLVKKIDGKKLNYAMIIEILLFKILFY